MLIKDRIITLLIKKDEEGSKHEAAAFHFSNLLMNTASITSLLARNVLAKPYPTIELHGKEFGPAVENPHFMDFMGVFNGDDLLRFADVAMQLYSFVLFILEQEEPEDDDTAWYDIEFLGPMWNEYARVRRESDAESEAADGDHVPAEVEGAGEADV